MPQADGPNCQADLRLQIWVTVHVSACIMPIRLPCGSTEMLINPANTPTCIHGMANAAPTSSADYFQQKT